MFCKTLKIIAIARNFGLRYRTLARDENCDAVYNNLKIVFNSCQSGNKICLDIKKISQFFKPKFKLHKNFIKSKLKTTVATAMI